MPAPAGRSCGTCILCCWLPDIDALDKPANVPCSHCSAKVGCAIYPVRPQLCRDFFCAWMADARLGDEWEPTNAHMMVYRQGPQTTVLVDPAYPDAWQQEPHASQLRQWAKALGPEGGYVIVFVGDDVFKVRPGAD